MNWIHEPFVQVALPIVVTLILAIFVQNKRLDEMSKRFDDRLDEMSKRFEDRFDAMDRRIDEIVRRLERIETKLDNHESRIAVLEDRTSRLRVS